MIKRIIFDQDNTIMMWHDEYYISLNKTFESLNIDYNENIINKLKEAVDNYEKEYNIFDKKSMQNIFEKYSKIELPDNFVDTWIHYLKECYPKEIDKALVDTLEYLSNKYELVILTNWFTESQEGRLENLGIKHYLIPDIEKKTPRNVIKICCELKRIVEKENISVCTLLC